MKTQKSMVQYNVINLDNYERKVSQMNFFQKDIETMPRKELEALQLERLKNIVAYCYNNTKFYHDKLDKAGVGDGSKIKVLSDIEYIPFTEKSEFRDNYPFGMVAVPHKDIVRVHASSGTTGKPTVGVYTKQAKEFVEKAEETGNKLVVMLNCRPEPYYRKIREMVQGGVLGELKRTVWIITNWYRTQDYYDNGGWRAT